MNGLSIIIPTHNRADELGPTLLSIGSVRVPQRLRAEVIVIDNNCTDNTPTIVAKSASSIAYPVRHVLETSVGASAARNRGIAEAKYDHLAFFDDDVRVAEDWIHSYVEAIEVWKADCIVGPVDPLMDGLVPEFVSESVLRKLCSPYSHKGDLPLRLDPILGHQLPGCNFGVTVNAASSVGGFDASIGPVGGIWRGGEDSDFGRRLVTAGFTTVYHPGCRIRHRIRRDKLTRSHLRTRWSEAGRAVSGRRSSGKGKLQRWRAMLGIGRQISLAFWFHLTSNAATAFEAELIARKSFCSLFPGKRHRPKNESN